MTLKQPPELVKTDELPAVLESGGPTEGEEYVAIEDGECGNCGYDRVKVTHRYGEVYQSCMLCDARSFGGWEWDTPKTERDDIHNPDGEDVVSVRTYKARPKYDDLTHEPCNVHEHVMYWWPDSYPDQGDKPLTDTDVSWEPVAEVTDDKALFEECLDSATYDPMVEVESLREALGQRDAEKLG